MIAGRKTQISSFWLRLNTIILVSIIPIIAMSRENYTLEPILATDVSDLGEGPHWDPMNQSLYYVDAFVGDVHRYESKKGIDSKINLGDLVTIVIPIENDPNHFLVSLRNKVIKLNWSTQFYEVIAECAPEHGGKERFNDGKIDAFGRLWIGTVLDGPNGVVESGRALYKLDLEQKRFHKMWWNFTLSNGMAWNRNNTLMYFNDSGERKTWVFDYDLTSGTVNNKRIFLDLDQHSEQFTATEVPDGMTMDNEDFLWISMYNGGRVVRVDPINQKVVESISVPALRTTSLTFGGSNLDQIYVTTGSSTNSTENEKYPNAGRVFCIKQKRPRFKGIRAFNLKL